VKFSKAAGFEMASGNWDKGVYAFRFNGEKSTAIKWLK
jgi:hypothetical protein